MGYDLRRRLVLATALLAASSALGAGPQPSSAPPALKAPPSVEALSKDGLLKRVGKDVVTELILDASGSMKQKIGQRTKLFQAKRVLRAFMTEATNESMALGLRVFGMREGDCKNTDLVFNFGEKGAGAVQAALDQINPEGYGKTPLALSLEKAAEDLAKHPDRPRRVIVVSDGIDSCGGDPCKVAQRLRREFDTRIFVVGYGLNAGEREQLKCLVDGGEDFFSADDLQSLINALKALSDQTKNLIVKSPDPLGISELWELDGEGKPARKAADFVSELGTRAEPGRRYEVRVKLNPTYFFKDVVVKPKEKKILEVKGNGTVTILFQNGLFTITLLNGDGKPVSSFPSDTPTQVPTGFYKIRAVSPPFAESAIDDVRVVPNGKYEERIQGFGALELKASKASGPVPQGYYVFDDAKKADLGSYMTGVPVVLPLGRYILKTVGNGILKNVYPDERGVRAIPMPPPGQTVTFARREKESADEDARTPRFLHQLTPDQLKEHLNELEKKIR